MFLDQHHLVIIIIDIHLEWGRYFGDFYYVSISRGALHSINSHFTQTNNDPNNPPVSFQNNAGKFTWLIE